MLLFAFSLSYLAMAALCLAMSRHHKVLLSGSPTPARQRGLRGLAVLGLGFGLALCWVARGGEIGAVLWLCLVMLAGLLLVALLAWRERWVLPLAAVLPVAGGVTALV
ncbi:DUF3325 domain-containing protein [Pseudomonas sp. PDM16]|uniref:DUF3325 domain-containing protein n=1 Tax=Pseudomonas sp. PDM16 TaxID=2769292 RepID=UPI00178186A3|nr:DUF3325 domain-containing protein [Pseudomonas sp. PDM16]MBD9414465.1 DUF3325 domain-containing protein [Pseudomonas sp. PDM16]